MAVVAVRDVLEGIDDLGIPAFANEELWGFSELDDGHAEERHDHDESAAGEPDVAPARVGVPVADDVGGFVAKGFRAGEVGEVGPGEETGDELAESPPGGHLRISSQVSRCKRGRGDCTYTGQQPLVFAWQVLQENRGVKDEVAAAAKSGQRHEEPKDDPVRAGASNDTEDRGDEQGEVEGVLASDDIRRETPEESANQHADVHSAGHAIRPAGVELRGSVSSNDGLDEQDERVHSVPETVQEEQLDLVGCEANLVDGIVDQMHLGVEDWVHVLETEQVALLDGGIIAVASVGGGLVVRPKYLLLLRQVFLIVTVRHLGTAIACLTRESCTWCGGEVGNWVWGNRGNGRRVRGSRRSSPGPMPTLENVYQQVREEG